MAVVEAAGRRQRPRAGAAVVVVVVVVVVCGVHVVVMTMCSVVATCVVALIDWHVLSEMLERSFTIIVTPETSVLTVLVGFEYLVVGIFKVA